MSASLHKRNRVLCSALAHTKSGGATGVYTYPVRKGASGGAWITLVTATEVGTGVLDMSVKGYTAAGTAYTLFANLTATITAAGTTHYWLGAPSATEESPCTEAFLNKVPENFDILLDLSGSTGASDGFTVTLTVQFV